MEIGVTANFHQLRDTTSPVKENNSHGIVAFYPRSFLLYHIDRTEPDAVGLQKYAAATTQDGVRVFILEDDISKDTFRNFIGNHEIIFNAPRAICREVHCDLSDDSQTWEIHAGDAFKLTDDPNLELRHIRVLTGNRQGSDIVGYIADEELAVLEQQGVVTRADFDHPRYAVDRTAAAIPNTECDKGVRKEVTVPKLGPTDQFVIETLNIGSIGQSNPPASAEQKRIAMLRDYGGPGEAFRFYLYDIVERKTQDRKRIISTMIFKCRWESFAEKLLYVKKVEMTIVHSDATRLTLTLEPWNTPDSLVRFTGGPYLWSVNNYRQYLEILQVLSAKFGDRSLAGFFLAELNRSCNKSGRTESECTSHAYSGSGP